MPVYINFLAEKQAAAERQRQDPVKRALWLGAFVICLVLMWGLAIFLKTTVNRLEIAFLEGKWKSLEKQVRQLEATRRETTELEKRHSALTQYATNRFLWANTLNALQQAVVDQVQLVHLKTEQHYTNAEAPSRAVERIVVHLDGRDFSSNAAGQVPHFEKALADAAFFQANLHRTNGVLLASLSPPHVEKNGVCVVFGLQLRFKEREHRLHD